MCVHVKHTYDLNQFTKLSTWNLRGLFWKQTFFQTEGCENCFPI